jgi:hypothetical protein
MNRKYKGQKRLNKCVDRVGRSFGLILLIMIFSMLLPNVYAESVSRNDGRIVSTTAGAEAPQSRATAAPEEIDVTVIATSGSKLFDLKPLTHPGYWVSPIPPNLYFDRVEVTTEGSIVFPGSTENNITSYRLFQGETDVTEVYGNHANITLVNGTFTVYPAREIIEGEIIPYNKVYDGYELTDRRYLFRYHDA